MKIFQGIMTFATVMILTTGFIACSSGDDDDDSIIQTDGNGGSSPSADTGSNNTWDAVVTGGTSNLTYESITIYGYVNDDTQAALGMGIIYGTENNIEKLATNGTKVPAKSFDPGTNNRRFTIQLKGLRPSTTYYYYAYAGQKTANEVLSFTTQQFDPRTAVDLGLSVKWAACNVGASSPEGRGGLFAWGETEPKSSYGADTYKWANGYSYYDVGPSRTWTIDEFTKYNDIDNLTVLTPLDDAAHVNWESDWRMPTYQEVQELISNTTHKIVLQNDVYGHLFTSKINGNSIFIPTDEPYFNNLMGTTNYYAGYWSATLTSNLNNAWCFSIGFYYWYDLKDEKIEDLTIGNRERFVGLHVRPVRP